MDMVDVWNAVRRHLLAFSLVIAACVGLAVLLNEVVTPSYRANVSLVANIASNPESSTYNEFLASQMLTKTYEDTIQSRYIASEVKKQVSTPDTVIQLLKKIKVRTDPGTLVIMLSYTGDDPKQTVAIANAFAETFIAKSKEIVAAANVSILDYASLEETKKPVSPRKALNIALAGFVGLFGGLSLALILDACHIRNKRNRQARRPLPEDYSELSDALVRIEKKYIGRAAK
ncbi:GNVR domain-containing protein [Paenibacillus phoenicis]|uniref:GNVR domain-containing protein n=1 Tax=Paenibacillus phoenicis TaxID=554117 RepID=A0ABU5PQN7_9BACL|nr:GNVR domain-containing protein [Paenibacillus phoenicis]MEA3572228.1 GNVR domain-containing protein [Paenibacillus phoenicis]